MSALDAVIIGVWIFTGFTLISEKTPPKTSAVMIITSVVLSVAGLVTDIF